MKSALDKLASNPLQVAVGVALIIGLAYLLVRKTVDDVAAAAGGVLSGDNALTEGTAYEGKGVLGTLGAAVNSATGGAGEWAGEAIGETLYQFFNPSSAGDSVTYIVTFPDGTKHAVAPSQVSATGGFTREGRAYQLYQDSAGRKFARAA